MEELVQLLNRLDIPHLELWIVLEELGMLARDAGQIWFGGVRFSIGDAMGAYLPGIIVSDEGERSVPFEAEDAHIQTVRLFFGAAWRLIRGNGGDPRRKELGEDGCVDGVRGNRTQFEHARTSDRHRACFGAGLSIVDA